MLIIIMIDGIEIFYKDWGLCGVQMVMFYYGWLFSGDDWDVQMMVFLVVGYCVIVYDCCGYGWLSQIVIGNDMDIYVVDVVVLIDVLDLKNVVYIGYLIGGGEVVCYVVYVSFGCVVKVVFISVVLLLMLKIDVNFGGVLIEVFDGICVQIVVDCV